MKDPGVLLKDQRFLSKVPGVLPGRSQAKKAYKAEAASFTPLTRAWSDERLRHGDQIAVPAEPPCPVVHPNSFTAEGVLKVAFGCSASDVDDARRKFSVSSGVGGVLWMGQLAKLKAELQFIAATKVPFVLTLPKFCFVAKRTRQQCGGDVLNHFGGFVTVYSHTASNK